ncbi:hypothetical protein MLD38_032855 [Melastoma candidum]|uniref:Uncharacterized protein n=1 Tax=Melastoma candidum TaxID=119954 RepID=A0ACB9M4Q9_9MYRT|nr:hypothetical protein MLD38_032855 [Melastoma candidum]
METEATRIHNNPKSSTTEHPRGHKIGINTHGGIVTDKPLQSPPKLQQPLGLGGRQITSPQLQAPQPPEDPTQANPGRVPPFGIPQDGHHLNLRDKPQDPPKLFQRPEIPEVRDIGAEVVDGGAREEAFELGQGLEAGVDVVEAARVELQRDGGVN